jgi:hypothetical protein
MRPKEAAMPLDTPSRAMPSARATHASHRAAVRLGLSVGIAIALAGCAEYGGSEPLENEMADEVRIWTDPSTGCRYLNWRKDIGTHAAAGSVSIRFRADGKPDCPASGTSGSAQDRNGLDPKGAGPTAEGGDAQP